MPNLKTIFPGLDPNDFGTGSAQVSTWAKGDDTSLIPSSKLPAIEIGNTFAFDSNEDTEALSLAAFYAVSTNKYNKGDIAIVTADADGTPSTISLIYVGTNQSSAGASAAVKSAGCVVSWGDDDYGGDCSAVQEQLAADVVHVYSTGFALVLAVWFHGAILVLEGIVQRFRST